MSFLRHNVPDLLQPVVHLPDRLEAFVLGRLLDRRTRPCHALVELGHDRVEAGDGRIDQRPVLLNPLEDLLLAELEFLGDRSWSLVGWGRHALDEWRWRSREPVFEFSFLDEKPREQVPVGDVFLELLVDFSVLLFGEDALDQRTLARVVGLARLADVLELAASRGGDVDTLVQRGLLVAGDGGVGGSVLRHGC